VLHAVVLTQYRRVTDGQTDGIAVASTALAKRLAFRNESPVVKTYCLVMAALRSRCEHYIFALCYFSSYSWFFPCLISVVTDWMSTILQHMMWP